MIVRFDIDIHSILVETNTIHSFIHLFLTAFSLAVGYVCLNAAPIPAALDPQMSCQLLTGHLGVWYLGVLPAELSTLI